MTQSVLAKDKARTVKKNTSGQHDDTAQLDERRENTPISLFDHQLGSVHGPATRDPPIEANWPKHERGLFGQAGTQAPPPQLAFLDTRA